MTRRSFVSLAATGAFLRRPSSGQSGAPIPYHDYSRCLPDFLRELAQKSYDLRNSALGKLATADAIRARQQWVTEIFWKLVGGKPERTPLNARTTGSFARDGYR